MDPSASPPHSPVDASENTDEQVLYVLEAKPGSLRKFSPYLSNRGWKIHSTTRVKEFLALVFQNQPPFVMICIDHPQPMAANLLRLIGNAFPSVKPIAWVDGTSSASLTKLKNSGHEYAVHPPLSGPAIERVLLRVTKDQQQAPEDPSGTGRSQISEVGERTEAAVVIKGSGLKAAQMTEQARTLLGQFMSAVETAEADEMLAQQESPTGSWFSRRHARSLPVFEQAEAPAIVQATDDALDKTVVRGDRILPFPEAISMTTSIACIAIESAKFNGYLVAALGQNRKIDERFIAIVRSRLVEFMRNAGEDFRADDAMDLQIEEVELEAWALEQAEFLRKSVHNGQEIAMAFFPEKVKQAPLEISASAQMLRLDIGELVADTRVEFDLYVYLPTNNKYVLYTRQQQVLHGVQIDRLKARGVSSMHLRQNDEFNVRRYRVRNFLNEKIREHRAASACAAG